MELKLSAKLELAHLSEDFGDALEGYAEEAAGLEAEVDRLREQVRTLQRMNLRLTNRVSAPPQQAQQILLSNAADDAVVLKRVQEQWAIERAQRRCIPATGEAGP